MSAPLAMLAKFMTWFYANRVDDEVREGHATMRLLWVLLLATFALRGDAQGNSGLTVADFMLIARADAFGVTQTYIEGTLENTDDQNAYAAINLYAEVNDTEGEPAAEGFGFVVDACGAALLPDFRLQPGQSVRFSVLLDVFAAGDAELDADAVTFTLSGDAVTPDAAGAALPDGLLRVSAGEVVQLEWIDDTTLRFGTGCDAHAFTALDWQQFDIAEGALSLTEHPAAQYVTDAFLAAAELTEPGALDHSYLGMHPESTRFVYQTRINSLYTIERDGQFRRLVADLLSRYSLHGIQWLPETRFLAYYYGAYGDPVRFIVGDASGRRLSTPIMNAPQSVTVPGAVPDASAVIISGTFDDVTGYYYHSTTGDLRQLLFEAEPAGNNYPAPVYRPREAGLSFIYLVRDVDGETMLQCYDSETTTLSDLIALPLEITLDERAWMSLSPDGTHLAFYANGVGGGLWLYDLAEAPACS